MDLTTAGFPQGWILLRREPRTEPFSTVKPRIEAPGFYRTNVLDPRLLTGTRLLSVQAAWIPAFSTNKNTTIVPLCHCLAHLADLPVR